MGKCLIVLLLMPELLCCQGGLFTGSSQYLGAGSLSRQFVDVFAAANNPGCLAELSSSAIGITSERKYLMNDLGVHSLATAYKLKNSGLGLQLSYLGNKQYNEWTSAIAYGLRCSKNILLGISMGYHHFGFTGYQKADGLMMRAGYLIYLTEKLKFTTNVEMLTSSFSEWKHDFRAASGFGYQLSDKLLMALLVAKKQQSPFNISMLVHYAFAQYFFIRTALSLLPGNSIFGLGLKWKSISLQLSSAYHMQLGVSPMLTLVFQKDNPGEIE